MDFCEAVGYLADTVVEKSYRDTLFRKAAIAVIEKASEGTFHSEKMACDEALRTLRESA